MPRKETAAPRHYYRGTSLKREKTLTERLNSSAFVLIMGRMVDDSEPCYNWYNVGLPTIFYPLYIFTEGAATYFPAVFAAGLLLLVFEHVSVTLHARGLLREETARLRQLNHLKN